MTRLRKPKLKEGELRVYWGREGRYAAPDVMLAWQGDWGMSRDTRLLYYYLCSQHPDTGKQPLFSVMQPSLIEELASRGYDITTLKFSIMKKQLPAIKEQKP